MRKKSYLGAIVSNAGVLALITLRHPRELVSSHDLNPPEGRDLTGEEKGLSQQLIDALTGDFDVTEYHDEYQSQLHALIRSKEEGKKIKAAKYKPPKENSSLVDSLRQSVNRVRVSPER